MNNRVWEETQTPNRNWTKSSSRQKLPIRVVRFSIRNPKATLLVWIVVTLALSPGLLRLKVDTSTDSVLNRTGDEWSFYQDSQELFGGDEIIVVALKSDDSFSPTALGHLRDLSTEIERIPGIERVDSLSTLPVVFVNSSGDLELEPALQKSGIVDADAVRRAKRLSSLDRIIPRTLVSADGKTVALTAIVRAGFEDSHDQILNEIYSRANSLGPNISGVPVYRVEANKKTRSEILRFAPLTLIMMALLLLGIFRRLRAAIFGLFPGVIGITLVLCNMGLFGVPLSITTMILPSMLIAMGCAYAMHVLMAARGQAASAALEEALTPLALPISLSGLTTAVGLLTLSVIQIDAVRHVGTYGALGVLLVSLLTLTGLPAILALLPLSAPTCRGDRSLSFRISTAAVELIESKKKILLSLWGVITCILAIGLSQVNVETDVTTWLGPGHPIRDSYELIRSELSGISPMNIVVSSVMGESVLEPPVLAAISGLVDFLEDQPEVGRAISISDPLRQLNGGLNQDSAMPLPQSRALAEQYMLLLESVPIIANVISTDRLSANVILRIDDNASADILDVAQRARRWWEQNAIRGFNIRATGIMYEFARAEDEIAYGQIAGLAIALTTIFVILLLILRQPLLAVVALLPNAIPISFVFGAMGLLGVPLDAGTVLIGGLALGVAVDDTIHVLTHFVSKNEEGLNSRESLSHAFYAVLPAVVGSTAIIALGFSVFVFSGFSLTKNLGWLTSSIVLICVLADITLLGPLLLGRDWRRSRANSAS